jgi:hypothetical protein
MNETLERLPALVFVVLFADPVVGATWSSRW